MSAATAKPRVLKGTLGPSVKIVGWLAITALLVGWLGVSNPASVIFLIVGSIFFSEGVSVTFHAVLGAALAASSFCILMVGDPKGDMVMFGLLVALAVIAVAGPMLGSSRLVIDRDGVSVTNFWATRRFRWSDTVVDRAVRSHGEPGAPLFRQKEAAVKERPLVLGDHYGLNKSDLFALLKQFSEAAAA